MPVYTYRATFKNREDHVESGTVVGRDEKDAREKLKELDLNHVTLKKLGGVQGLVKRFVADVR